MFAEKEEIRPMVDDLNATDGLPEAVEAPEPAPEVEPLPVDAEFPEAVDAEDPADVVAEPVIPAPVAADPMDARKADAKSRSLRTLAQGAIMAVFIQLVLVGYPYVSALNSGKPVHIDWMAAALVALQTAGAALLSYLHKALGLGEK